MSVYLMYYKSKFGFINIIIESFKDLIQLQIRDINYWQIWNTHLKLYVHKV
jgi:hypothetical protein